MAGFLDSLGTKVAEVGTKVGNKLDSYAKQVLDSTNSKLKNELAGVFQEVGVDNARLTEKMNELQLPEVYKNAALFLIQNKRAFDSAKNLPAFLQVLLDTQADKFLGSIDANATSEVIGARSDDATIVVGLIQSIVRLKAQYTPQDNNFNKEYRYSAQGVMVRQENGEYLPLSQNTKRIPEEATYKNLIPNLIDHINGLDGGYTANEVSPQTPSIDAKQEAAKLTGTEQTPVVPTPDKLQDLSQAA